MRLAVYLARPRQPAGGNGRGPAVKRRQRAVDAHYNVARLEGPFIIINAARYSQCSTVEHRECGALEPIDVVGDDQVDVGVGCAVTHHCI